MGFNSGFKGLTREKKTYTICAGGWVDIGSGVHEKCRKSCPNWGSTTELSKPQQVTVPHRLSRPPL